MHHRTVDQQFVKWTSFSTLDFCARLKLSCKRRYSIDFCSFQYYHNQNQTDVIRLTCIHDTREAGASCCLAVRAARRTRNAGGVLFDIVEQRWENLLHNAQGLFCCRKGSSTVESVSWTILVYFSSRPWRSQMHIDHFGCCRKAGEMPPTNVKVFLYTVHKACVIHHEADALSLLPTTVMDEPLLEDDEPQLTITE